jgi:hypothetical protein
MLQQESFAEIPDLWDATLHHVFAAGGSAENQGLLLCPILASHLSLRSSRPWIVEAVEQSRSVIVRPRWSSCRLENCNRSRREFVVLLHRYPEFHLRQLS